MQNENDLSPLQSLALIESMLNKAKNRFSENGHLYFLWGWIVFFCAGLQFVLLHFFEYAEHYKAWMLTWVGVIYQIYYLKKRNKARGVRTYTDEIIGFVWITFIILMFLISFLLGRLGGTPDRYYQLITPVLLALYGMPVFLSGIILKFKPLIFGGIGCWILSVIAIIVSPTISYDYMLLFVPLAMVVAWIIPGYYLKAKYKSEIV